jgi:hypothetical protein
MNTTHNTKTKRLIAAVAVAAAAAVAPALPFAGAGIAHADPCYDNPSVSGSYYCSPGGGGLNPPGGYENPFGSEPSVRDAIQHPTRLEPAPSSPGGEDCGLIGGMFGLCAF